MLYDFCTIFDNHRVCKVHFVFDKIIMHTFACIESILSFFVRFAAKRLMLSYALQLIYAHVNYYL
jgi:hypothetical protein